jgi:hypothetical protein
VVNFITCIHTWICVRYSSSITVEFIYDNEHITFWLSFRGFSSWFVGSVALGNMSLQEHVAEKNFSPHGQEARKCEEELRGLTITFKSMSLHKDLLLVLPPQRVPAWGTSLQHMDLWRTFMIQTISVYVCICIYYMHSFLNIPGNLVLGTTHIPKSANVQISDQMV